MSFLDVAVAARIAALLLRATADALDTFARSLIDQRAICPPTVPEWMNEEVDL